MISTQKLFDEVYKKTEQYCIEKESFDRTMRKKFDFLIKNVLMRSKLDYKIKNKNMIPKNDAPIIKALLVKSYEFTNDGEEDQLFVDWFNGRIREDDYKRIVELSFAVNNLLDNLYNDNYEIDMVTKEEWINTIDAAINFQLARSVLIAEKKLKMFYDSSAALNHNIPLGDSIIKTSTGCRVKQWEGLKPDLSLNSNLGKVFDGCFSQQSYFDLLFALIDIMSCDAHCKTIEFIKSYAEVKKMKNANNIDDLIEKGTLASEYMRLFQNIHDYLELNKKTAQDIELEIGTDNLLDFFNVKGRD